MFRWDAGFIDILEVDHLAGSLRVSLSLLFQLADTGEQLAVASIKQFEKKSFEIARREVSRLFSRIFSLGSFLSKSV